MPPSSQQLRRAVRAPRRSGRRRAARERPAWSTRASCRAPSPAICSPVRRSHSHASRSGVARGGEADDEQLAVEVERQPTARRRPPVSVDGERARRPAESRADVAPRPARSGNPRFSARHHALGHVDEPIVHRPVARPHRRIAQQPPTVAAQREAQRLELDLQRQRRAFERDHGVCEVLRPRARTRARSQPRHTIFPSRSQKARALQANSSQSMTEVNTTRSATRVDMHCHSTASAVSKLGIQRSVGLPECATPPDEVYELAKRRGMDFVTITDHDTIARRARAAGRTLRRRVRQRGAHGLVPRRAAGRARALLRHHARRPRVAAAPQRRRRGVRRVPARARHHVRARPPVLRGRGAADAAPPPPARRAVPDLGDAQRLARPRAQRARRGLHRDARRHRHRRHRRPRRRRHRPHVDRDAARGDARGVPRAHPRRPRDRVRRPGRRREVGARGDGARDPLARRRRGGRQARPGSPS